MPVASQPAQTRFGSGSGQRLVQSISIRLGFDSLRNMALPAVKQPQVGSFLSPSPLPSPLPLPFHFIYSSFTPPRRTRFSFVSVSCV